MKASFVLVAALLGSLAPTLAPQVRAADAPPADLAKVDAILARYVEALGGKTALERITNSIAKATATVAGMEMQVELLRATPARQASRVEIPGMGTIRDVYDGQHAWSVNPFAGNAEKTGEQLAKTARDAAFHQALQMKQLFAPLIYKGSETIETRKVEVLEAKLAGGALERLYFGADTGLLVRRDSEFESGAGRVKTENAFEDYRPVDGVKQPHTMRLKIEAAGQDAMDIQFKITELRQNVVLPANAFAKPE
jgi:zinc protease